MTRKKTSMSASEKADIKPFCHTSEPKQIVMDVYRKRIEAIKGFVRVIRSKHNA